MKTITELNSKWWYRLVKVAFIICFLLISTLIVEDTIDNKRPYQTIDLDNSFMVCTDFLNQRLSTFSYTQLGVSQSERNYNPSVDTVSEKCNIPEYKDNPDTIDTSGKSRLFLLRNNNNSEWIKRIRDSYRLEVTEKTVGSWLNVALLVFIQIVGVAIVFEIVRRILYYVILGTIKPKKL
jgi:sensor histidine kinase YesM